jgi:hypothetical protein
MTICRDCKYYDGVRTCYANKKEWVEVDNVTGRTDVGFSGAEDCYCKNKGACRDFAKPETYMEKLRNAVQKTYL